jgi:predicted SAM-dependent methyltransferase
VNFTGKRVLHVGCGKSPLPTWLDGAKETRLDIDPQHKPDVVGDMREVERSVSGKFDVVYSTHAIEHLYPHEVIEALHGFRKVLDEDGIAIVIVPNLKGIQPTEDVVYESPSGPITGIDMYYGLTRVLKDMPYMAHHSGFVKETLEKAFVESGYRKVEVREDDTFNLIAVGVA